MAQPERGRSGAPYLHVAEAVLDAIRQGRYGPGDALPSYKALAAEHGVAPGTAQSAIGRLREQGIVETRHGAGSIVNPSLDVASLGSPAAADDRRWDEVLALLGDISSRLSAIEAKLDGVN